MEITEIIFHPFAMQNGQGRPVHKSERKVPKRSVCLPPGVARRRARSTTSTPFWAWCGRNRVSGYSCVGRSGDKQGCVFVFRAQPRFDSLLEMRKEFTSDKCRLAHACCGTTPRQVHGHGGIQYRAETAGGVGLDSDPHGKNKL